MLLPLKDPLVVTFNERRAPTSRKYVAEQGIVMPNWSKTCQTFWSQSSVFSLEKQPKNLKFHGVFTSKRLFGGYFQWNACTFFRKHVAEQGIVMPKWSKTFQNFLVALHCFCFRKFLEYFGLLNDFVFLVFVECMHSVRITCSLAAYSDTKYISDTSSFMLPVLPFF